MPTDPKPVITYDFNGVKHIQQGHSVRAVSGEECELFERIAALEQQQDWRSLCDLCEAQIVTTPEWLTPYLCSGVAHANLGHAREAIERLEFVDRTAGDNPLYAAAGRILAQLRREAANGPASPAVGAEGRQDRRPASEVDTGSRRS